MKENVKITASIICADYSNLGKDVAELNSSGVYGIHHDIMDGVFVPNITHGPALVKALRPLSGLVFDTHLMIINPEKYIKTFIEAGSDVITVHYETCKEPEKSIEMIKENGAKAMVSVNPETPIEKIFPLLSSLDGVLVMSVRPGFAGQKFMPEVMPKVNKLTKHLQENKIKLDIQIDGGINTANISSVVEAGVNYIVIGNSIFSKRPFKKTVSELLEAI